MFKIQSYEQLQRQVGEARNHRFVTNFFLDEEKHSLWIAKGDCMTEKMGNTLFIIRVEGHFWNVFYSSTTYEQLAFDLQQFMSDYANQTMLFDVVGRDVQCQEVVDMLQGIGCRRATSLVRMTRVNEPIRYSPDPTIRKAKEEDVPQVSQQLNSFFDVQTEQIPYDEELCAFARLGHVLLCEEDGKLAGFLIYELNNTTLYFRYWFTHPDFRERGIGSRLFRRAFEDGKETRRQLLWVIQSNENAIKRYRHYGFKEENMFDYVMRFN